MFKKKCTKRNRCEASLPSYVVLGVQFKRTVGVKIYICFIADQEK